MQQSFSSQKFRTAITQFSNLEKALTPFLQKCDNFDMIWMLNILQDLYDFLHNSKLPINLVFNSMFALKHLISTGNIAFLNLVEIYLLPKLQKIAAFDFSTVSQRRGFSYFIDKGFQGKRIELEQYGNSYVRMASQLIIACAAIKPKVLLEHQELPEPSEYAIALHKLQKRGIDPNNYVKFYRDGQITKIRQLFKNSLSHFSRVSQRIATFYSTIVLHFLKGEPDSLSMRYQLHPNKVFKAGDVIICKKILRQCFASLLSSDLVERKRALSVINNFVLWGDILVAYAVNVIGVMDQAIEEIANPHERQTDSTRALYVLRKYKNTEEEKRSYYNEFLKSLQFWAMCFPYPFDNSNTPSLIHQAYLLLQEKLDIQFPDFIVDIRENYAIFDLNFKNKQTRNNRLIQIFYQNAQKGSRLPKRSPTLMGPGPISGKKSFLDRQVSYHDLFDGFASPAVSQFQLFKQQMSRIAKMLKEMCYDKSLIQKHSQGLKSFAEQFDAKIISGNFNENELNYLISQGAPLIQKIEDVMPAIERYMKGTLSYPQLRSYMVGYKQQNHEQKIQENILKKKQTILKSLQKSSSLHKELSYQNNQKLVLPYTESHEAFGSLSHFHKMPKFIQLAKYETNVRQLIAIDEQNLFNTNRKAEEDNLMSLRKVPHLESNSQAFKSIPASSVSKSQKIIDVKDLSSPGSKGEAFVEIPRMTSLESKIMHSKSRQSMQKSLSKQLSQQQSLSPNSNDQNLLKAKKNSEEVVQKYGEGILKISQRNAEEQIDTPFRQNLKSQGWSSIHDELFCPISPGNSRDNIRDSKSAHSKLEKFMQMSSFNFIPPDSDNVHELYNESGFEYSRYSPKATNQAHNRKNQQNPINNNLGSSSKNKVQFSRTGSQIVEKSEDNKINKKSICMKRVNIFLADIQTEAQPRVYITSVPTAQNQILTHRKSKTMDIPSNIPQLNSPKELQSEPEEITRKQQILKCLSPKNKVIKNTQSLVSPQSLQNSKEYYFKANTSNVIDNKQKQSTFDYSQKISTNSPSPYEINKQVFIQRGFYKQKQKNTKSSESDSRVSQCKQPPKAQNIYTKI